MNRGPHSDHDLDAWVPPLSGDHPDKLSVERATTFFDFEFEAWSGISHDGDGAGDNSPFGNIDHWALNRSPEDFCGLDQAGQQHFTVDTSWIEPGLIPFADGLDIVPSIFDGQSTVDPSNIMPHASAFSGLDRAESYADQYNPFTIPTASIEQGSSPFNATTPVSTHLQAPNDGSKLVETPLVTVLEKKRARISKAAKKILKEHFRINPYPTDAETSALASNTQLQGRTIKTWFSNTRSRTKPATIVPTENSSLTNDHLKYHNAQGSIQSITRRSLEALEKVSPAASMNSLQRYLAIPPSEEAVSTKVIDAVKVRAEEAFTGQTQNDIDMPLLAFHGNAAQLRSRGVSYSKPTRSIAESESSRGSTQSQASHCSFRTVDSRGSRRGRKLWVRSEQRTSRSNSVVSMAKGRQGKSPSADHQIASLEAKEKSSFRISCTWPSCDAAFKFPFEWRRHEEAMHYQPNHYVCCLESTYNNLVERCFVCNQTNATIKHIVATHMKSCMNKRPADRAFFRKDQLVQHIKGVHRVGSLTGRHAQELLSLWKRVNPQMCENTLKCGFCDNRLTTWEDRQNHVLKHLQAGVCKSSWWPERMPTPAETRLKSIDGSLTCTKCGFICSNDFLMRGGQHNCMVWSCRSLHDFHALFAMDLKQNLIISSCKLCMFTTQSETTSLSQHQYLLDKHAQFHRYRSCNQDWFTNEREFASHLVEEHLATHNSEFELSLQVWTSHQWLRGDASGAKVVLARRFFENFLCASDSWAPPISNLQPVSSGNFGEVVRRDVGLEQVPSVPIEPN